MSEFLLHTIAPIEPPTPDKVEVAHDAAHVGVGDEKEEKVVDKTQEVERKVRISTFTVRNDPKRNEVGEVGCS
jgi:hypothetical protein